MLIVPREKIIVGKRQRSKLNPQHINALKHSIVSKALINAPLCFPQEDGTYLLGAGECRLSAIDKIAGEGLPFFHNGQPIAPGEVPITIARFDMKADEFEVEFDENEIREKLDWKDRTEALAALHEMRLVENPKQTFKDTAEEVLRSNKSLAGGTDTGGINAAKNMASKIHEAKIVAEHLDDPTISGARNATEAYALVLKKQEEKALSTLARKRMARIGEKPTLDIRHGNLEDILPKLDDGIADLFLADPPYGIDAGSGGFRARTVHHHNYTDDVDTARSVAKTILTEAFRICKPQANIFLFTDIKHWEYLQTISAQIGWTPFRRPLIWGKSDSEGLAPWGSKGPRLTTEYIFYATKGQKGLISSPIDYLRVNRVSRHERIHAAEKPVELLSKLIECSTLPGDFVIDPCCGSGSTLVACRETKRLGLGIEKDPTFYDTAMANVHGKEDKSGEVPQETSSDRSVEASGEGS